MFRSRISSTLPLMVGSLAVLSSAIVGYQAYLHASSIIHGLPTAGAAGEVQETGLASLRNSIIGTVVGVVMVTQLCGQIYAWKISCRLRNLVHAIHELRDGKTDIVVPYLNDKGEIGDLASAFQAFKETSLKVSVLSDGQQQAQMHVATRAEQMGSLIRNFDKQMENALGQLTNSATDMQKMARSMVGVADLTNTRTESVVSASEETANNVRAVAAAAEELSASIAEISSQVARSAEISQGAVQRTQRADRTVQELEKAANKIGDVSQLIRDIADQINLLALNATIESARAGEAGKGFAVVASEVKTLASQTTKATQEIALQIRSIQDVAADVVEVLVGIRSTINEISDIATSISTSVGQQGAATREIASNMSAAALVVQEVSSHSVTVRDASLEANSSAKQVLTASEGMAHQSQGMRAEIERFLKEIRSV